MIKPLSKEHASQVADLHIDGISTGFISSLGKRFVTALYESIPQSDYGFGYVEEDEGDVAGFVAFTTDLKGLYKSVLRRNFIRFSFLLFYKMCSWKQINRAFETLVYPSRMKKIELPEAELLSIAVCPKQRVKGIANKLIQKGLSECRGRGIKKLKVLVADSNKPANALYQKAGFEKVTRIENHGIVSNVYVVSTDHFIKTDT